MKKTANTVPYLLVLFPFVQLCVSQITWKQSQTPQDFVIRFQHQAYAFDSKLWVTGGINGKTANTDVWSSANGTTWTKIADTTAYPMHVGCVFMTFQGALWVYGGWKGC